MANNLLYKAAAAVLNYADDEAIALDKAFASQLQDRLSNFWLLKAGTADGLWGEHSLGALQRFKAFRGINEPGVGKVTASELINTDPSNLIKGYKLDGSWASRAIMWMNLHHFHVSGNGQNGEINIVYFRGLDNKGNWDDNAPFVWNDRRTVLLVKNGIPSFGGNWLATVDPGEYYWENPMNEKGCADVKACQFQAWSVGDHKGQHALVQSDAITVFRGEDRVPDTGNDFGVDQHTTRVSLEYYKGDDVGKWSAGCLVGADANEHYNEFMPMVDADPREKRDVGGYKHWTTIISGDKFLDYFPNE